MCPSLSLFGYSIPTYGICALVGVGAAFLIAFLRVRKSPAHSVEDTMFMLLYGMVGVLVGAKLLYLIQVSPALIRDLPLLFSDVQTFSARYLSGGFVFYGGLIGGIAGAMIYCRQFKLHLFDYANRLIVIIPIFHGIGRIGCFLSGCCYGIPCDPPLGIAFSHSQIAPNGVPLFPVQLLEVCTNLILFVLLLWLTNRKQCKRSDGVAFYLCYYAVVRFLLEYLRYDDAERGFIGFLSTSQFISLFIFAAGILLFIKGDALVSFLERKLKI